jgi:DGQHR domain-containing protein
MTTSRHISASAITLQQNPLIYLTALPGDWLLEHSTPSWRIDNPQEGFQRIVKEDRARQIAIAVLDQQRTFPNAIVLATDAESFSQGDHTLRIPNTARFLVVDGQHRLWAQHHSDFIAHYACVIHMQLSEVKMATLFLEINDTQKRVPASLRWDLVRLVRPTDDPFSVESSELIYQLATETHSPLFQRIDLTGELSKIPLKQASLAPEIKTVISARGGPLRGLDFEKHYDVLCRYFAAIKSLDPDGWNSYESPFYKARVLRVLIRLLPEIIQAARKSPVQMTAANYREYLNRIDPSMLETEAIRAAQGSAGMKAIQEQIRKQLFG